MDGMHLVKDEYLKRRYTAIQLMWYHVQNAKLSRIWRSCRRFVGIPDGMARRYSERKMHGPKEDISMARRMSSESARAQRTITFDARSIEAREDLYHKKRKQVING